MNLFKKISLLSLFILLSGSLNHSIYAQSKDKEAVKKTIEMLFDGMRASDSSMVAAAFSKDALMKTVTQNNKGETVVQTGDLQEFLNAVGTPKDKVWDEKIKNYDINIDGNLATVWTPYEFWTGQDFSHCGVNSFQMVKSGGEWKIIYIIDTRRQQGCRE